MRKELKLDIEFWWNLVFYIFMIFAGIYEIIIQNNFSFIIKAMLILIWIDTLINVFKDSSDKILNKYKELYNIDKKSISDRIKWK